MPKKLTDIERLTLLGNCPSKYLNMFTELVDIVFSNSVNNNPRLLTRVNTRKNFKINTFYEAADVLSFLDSKNIPACNIRCSGFRRIRIELEFLIFVEVSEAYPPMMSLSFPQDNYTMAYEWDLNKDLSNLVSCYREARSVIDHICRGKLKDDLHTAISVVCRNKHQIVGGSGRIRLKDK